MPCLKLSQRKLQVQKDTFRSMFHTRLTQNGWWGTRQQGNEDLFPHLFHPWSDPEMTPERWLNLAYETEVSQDFDKPHSADIYTTNNIMVAVEQQPWIAGLIIRDTSWVDYFTSNTTTFILIVTVSTAVNKPSKSSSFTIRTSTLSIILDKQWKAGDGVIDEVGLTMKNY